MRGFDLCELSTTEEERAVLRSVAMGCGNYHTNEAGNVSGVKKVINFYA